MKRPALQNKWVGVLRMAFRSRKNFGSFEKPTPGQLHGKHVTMAITAERTLQIAYLMKKKTNKNKNFARLARAFLIFVQFATTTTWEFNASANGNIQPFLSIFTPKRKLVDGNVAKHLFITLRKLLHTDNFQAGNQCASSTPPHFPRQKSKWGDGSVLW